MPSHGAGCAVRSPVWWRFAAVRAMQRAKQGLSADITFCFRLMAWRLKSMARLPPPASGRSGAFPFT